MSLIMNLICGLPANSLPLVWELRKGECLHINMKSLICGKVRLCISFFFHFWEVNKARAPWQLPVFLLRDKYHPLFTVVRFSVVGMRKRHSGTQHIKATQSHVSPCFFAALKKSPMAYWGSGRLSGWRCSTAGTSSCWKSTKRFVAHPCRREKSIFQESFAFSKLSFDMASLPFCHRQVKERCQKGIPPSLRGRAWLYLTGAKVKREQSKGKFQVSR